MTIRTSDRRRGVALEVRHRRTIADGGKMSSFATVHCPRRETAVSLAECVLCGDCDGVYTSEDGTFVACAQELASEPEGRRRRRYPSAADQIPVTAVMTTEVVCVRSDLSIEALAALFVDLNITGAPVVDDRGHPIGVVSKSDLVRADLESTETGEALRDEESMEHGFHLEPSSRGRVSDIMMPIAFTVPENATLSHAAALMAYEGVHRVPVISGDGTVVGIVSAMDVVRWLASNDGYLIPPRPLKTDE